MCGSQNWSRLFPPFSVQPWHCFQYWMFNLGLPAHDDGRVPAHEVELDPFCTLILLARMQDGVLEKALIHDNVKDFRPCAKVASEAEAITAGFPCQAPCHCA